MSDKTPMTFDAVFHGSPVRIGRFDGERCAHGFFFADRKEVAIDWANETAERGLGWLTTARVTLKDPLVIDADGAHWSEIPNPWRDGEEREIDQIAGDAEAAGFDGMVVKNVQDGPDTMDGATNTTIVAFSEDQIEILARTKLTVAECPQAAEPVDKTKAPKNNHLETLTKLRTRLTQRRLSDKLHNHPDWYAELAPKGYGEIFTRLNTLVLAHKRVTTGWTPTSIRGYHEHWILFLPHPAASVPAAAP